MGIIQRLLGKSDGNKEFKEKFKQAQEEDKIYNLIEERKKSSNKRELERYYKEQEEARIKQALDKIHKKGNEEMWKSKNLILGQKTTMLNCDKPILKEKNIFKGNKNTFTKEYAIKNKTDMGFFK